MFYIFFVIASVATRAIVNVARFVLLFSIRDFSYELIVIGIFLSLKPRCLIEVVCIEVG